MFETEILLDDDTRQDVIAECVARGSGSPKLDPVRYDDGDVQCIALNLQGQGNDRCPGRAGCDLRAEDPSSSSVERRSE